MSHTPSSGDHFRIGMQLGYGPTLPAAPVPVPPATSWWDVYDWQDFLKKRGFLVGASYPTNMFDQSTATATQSFQGSATYSPVLPMTGIVNQATYDKAVAAGMTPYPTS